MDLSLKRIIAYVIDILVVTVFTSLILSIPNINPYQNKYNETYDKYVELTKSNEINKDLLVEYNHDLYLYKVYSSGVSMIVLLIYFGLLEYYFDGQTIGKKLLKIKTVSNNAKKLGVHNYLLKIVILNNMLFTIMAYIILYLFDKNVFFYSTYVIGILESLVILAIILMIILKKDNRALHDILSNTKVIDLKDTIYEK